MIKDILFELSKKDSVGNITQARDFAFELLNEHCDCQKTDTLTVIGFLKGESDYTLMLDAHIDQIGMVVTDIDDNGFLTVCNAGGFDLRALPSKRVTIHAKEKIKGVFSSVPPHLKESELDFKDIKNLKIDTLLGNKAKDIVSLGDYVTFEGEPMELLNYKVVGKSFDDRAGVACLIEIAKRLKGEKLPVSIAFVLSDGEEVGLRGTRPATYKVNPDEAIALDVSFGTAPDVSSEEAGMLSNGPMIGFSPCLDSKMSKKLVALSKEKNIPYQTEVMASKSGTNADMISVSREGVKAVTVSIPLKNMHSDCEILDLRDLEYTCDLICEYIRNGGVKND